MPPPTQFSPELHLCSFTNSSGPHRRCSGIGLLCPWSLKYLLSVHCGLSSILGLIDSPENTITTITTYNPCFHGAYSRVKEMDD